MMLMSNERFTLDDLCLHSILYDTKWSSSGKLWNCSEWLWLGGVYWRKMLASDILRSITWKSWNAFRWRYSRCFFSSKICSEKEADNFNLSNSDAKTDEKNEWLWAYLRSQKSFSDLTDEQRQRVIELGKIIDRHFLYKLIWFSRRQNFKHYVKVENVRLIGYLMSDGPNYSTHLHWTLGKVSMSKWIIRMSELLAFVD